MSWTFGYVPVQSSEHKCQRETHVPVTHIPSMPHAKHWQQRNKPWGNWCSLGCMSSLADGSGAEGLAFLAGRWGPAGSDEPTQFVSHPHLPQCCWAVLESSWAFPPRPSHSPAHSALVLWGSNYTPGGRPMICSGSSTGAGIHEMDLLLRMKQWEKQAQVRAWIIPLCCKASVDCAGAHTPPTEPPPRITINHPAINPPCFAFSQLECSICYSMSMWQWQSLMRHIGLWIGSSIPTGSTVTVAQNTALEKSISCLFAGAGLQLGSGLIVSSLSFP